MRSKRGVGDRRSEDVKEWGQAPHVHRFSPGFPRRVRSQSPFFHRPSGVVAIVIAMTFGAIGSRASALRCGAFLRRAVAFETFVSIGNHQRRLLRLGGGRFGRLVYRSRRRVGILMAFNAAGRSMSPVAEPSVSQQLPRNFNWRHSRDGRANEGIDQGIGVRGARLLVGFPCRELMALAANPIQMH